MTTTNCKNNGGGSKATKMPKSVLDAAERVGGELTKLHGEDYCALTVTFGDEAYKVVNQWVATLEGDPMVNVVVVPPLNILGTAICPPLASWPHIHREASSIAHHYAPLDAGAFSHVFPHHPVNPIPGPLAGPVMNVSVHHARIALNALHARIQDPNDPNYPVISDLPSGSYICTVTTGWGNVNYTVAIYKN
jgi:hypothetical protein